MSICRNDWIIGFFMSQVISRCPIAMRSPAAMRKHFAENGRRKRKYSMYAAAHRFMLLQSHMLMSCGSPESNRLVQGIPGFRRFLPKNLYCFQQNKRKGATSCIIAEDKQEGREHYAFCRSNRKRSSHSQRRSFIFSSPAMSRGIFRIIRSVRC